MSSEDLKVGFSRRRFLGASAAVWVAAGLGCSVPAVRPSEPLKVGTYGGYFKDSFDKHIYPDFTAETGIEIESIAQPSAEAWLLQLNNAARAGIAPADVSMIAQNSMLKGQATELWAPLDLDKIPNSKYLLEHYVHRYSDGRVDGIGAVAWYITLVTNTEIYPEAPTSWAALWDKANEDRVGLLALATNSFLLEITATTFFGGTEILDTEEGILEVMRKVAELKPNVKLWYREESQFQQALQSGEIPMGQYYHDVAGLAAADGFPVRSTMPKEGGVNDSGSWAVTRSSKRLDDAHTFIDYMSRPAIQAKLARKVGTAPTVRRDATDLTDEEFAAVASDIPPVIPRYDMYQQRAEWLDQRWTELVTG